MQGCRRRSGCSRQRALRRVEICLGYIFLWDTGAGPAQFCNRSTGVFVVLHNNGVQTTASRYGYGAASFRWFLVLPPVNQALPIHPQPYTIVSTGVERIGLSEIIFRLHLPRPANCKPVVWHCWRRGAIPPIKRHLRVYPCQNQIGDTGKIGRGRSAPGVVFAQESCPVIVTGDEFRDI